ncbi:MAG: choice-of-anchor Q domain-containing protein [Alcanivorax sediminis]|uniref:choice-of-anchor Q domain-containing protein n=1 Tax=Alcanivorax sediminis TaxID=2663008 RepID=UPI003C5FA18F
MRHLGLWQCLAGCTLIFAATSHATVYEINSTTDPVVTVVAVDNIDESPNPQVWDKDTKWQATTSVADGLCSVREAVYASNYRISVDGCAAGTGSDTIKLKANTNYLLSQGSLPIGIGEKVVVTSEEVPDTDTPDPNDTKTEYTVTFEPLSNQIAINIQLDAFEDAEDKVRPVISAGNQSRVFTIHDGGAMSLANLELRDGDATVPVLTDPEIAEKEVDNNGGLIRAAGTVIINRNVVLAGGAAGNGGALYMTEGSGTSFSNGGRFEDNVATGFGSVIATSDTFDGNIIGYDFYMANNTAGGGVDAGVIYMDGGVAPQAAVMDNSVNPPVVVTPAVAGVGIGMELGNGTITGNTGGVINVVSENHTAVLVNMTIAFNEGVALTLAESGFADPADAETRDHILHTAIVGNDGGACAGAVLDGTAVNADAAARLLFTITDDANCPTPEEQTEGVPVTVNPNGAQEDVFLGEGRVECAIGIKGAGACLPMTAEEIGGPYPGFLPNPHPAAVVADPLASPGFASLFDRGNPENSSVDTCEGTDNRGNARGGPGGRCDVGSIEFLRARAEPEEINMISGKSVLGDVVANDLNDTVIDCNLLNDIVDVDNSCAGDQACIDQGILDRCLTIIEYPELGTAVPVIDANGYPRIRYTPSSNFHGVDQIRYKVDKDAFDGGADLGQDQDEIANFFAEPASGLTEKDSIGSFGGIMTLMLVFAGMLRRFARAARILLPAAALLTAGQAMAVEITVNSLEDRIPSIPNDGKCTLREALLNAGAAASPDCAYGGNSTDTILLPAGEIQLAGTLIIEGGGVEIVGKGALDDATDDEETLTTIRGNGSSRLFEVQPPNPNLGHPSVRFQYLTLEDGNVSGNGTDGTGSGAVIITGGSVIFDRVRILNNYAEANGGVVFMRANAGEEKLLTFNRSFVSGNTAGISGGVMSSTAQYVETFKVAIIDSTFDGNSAAVEGGVLDANIRAGEVQIANSTFVNSVAPKGSALDFSGLAVNANIMNSTFMNNTGGLGIDLGDAATETRMGNSAYFDSGDSCSTGATILHESEYNAYSGTACVADTASTTDQASTGSASLAASLSTPDGEGTRDDYVPPYLGIVNGEFDTVLLNKGNDVASLVSGTGSPLACRATDLRGIDRTSGGICDVGAFEYQQITAEDDEGSNQNTPARQVPVDILDNDLPSDGAEFVLLDGGDPPEFATNIYTFWHAEPQGLDPEEYLSTTDEYVQDATDKTLFTLDMGPTPSDPSMNGATIRFVWLYYNEDRAGYDLNCGDPIPQNIIDANPSLFEDGDVADECVVLFTPPSNEEFDTRMCNSDSENPVTVAFNYTFEDSAGQVSNEATAVMTLKDKAPVLQGASVVNQPGKRIEFDIKIEDPDNPDAVIDWTRYNITLATKPSFAKRDEDGQTEGTGLIIIDRYDEDSIPHSDPADANRPAKVIYTPDSNYNTFKDVFTLKVQDMNCGPTSQQARFTISYNNKETSAGSGSMGWMLLGGVLLLLRRRFTA